MQGHLAWTSCRSLALLVVDMSFTAATNERTAADDSCPTICGSLLAPKFIFFVPRLL